MKRCAVLEWSVDLVESIKQSFRSLSSIVDFLLSLHIRLVLTVESMHLCSKFALG